MSQRFPKSDSDVYGFAPADPLEVTPAAGCSTLMTDDKREAVKGYIGKVGPELHRRYGKRDYYEPNQVRDTVAYLGLNFDWMCWAYLLYCSPPVFHDLHVAAGEVCDRDGMWTTVAGTFFNGNTDFSPMVVSDTILSGLTEAAGGAVETVGWLADIDWGGLLDWS